jgi:hypothetical protein
LLEIVTAIKHSNNKIEKNKLSTRSKGVPRPFIDRLTAAFKPMICALRKIETQKPFLNNM